MPGSRSLAFAGVAQWFFSVWLWLHEHPAGVKTRSPFVCCFGTTKVMPCYKTLPIRIEDDRMFVLQLSIKPTLI